MQKATELISSLRGQFVAIAVSGGKDSMCLLHMCLQILGKDNLLVLSVNHNLRGDESDGDYEFVQQYCTINGCKFLGKSVDVQKISAEHAIGTELAARYARRKFFLSVRERVTRVLLAHHQSDQAETVLLHMFRGCGQDGLKGMDVLTDNYFYRPLLSSTKLEIDNYIRINCVPYRTDSTNATSNYDRNFLRNEVIPLLEQRWSGVQRSIARLASIMSTHQVNIEEKYITAEDDRVRLDFSEIVASKSSQISQFGLNNHSATNDQSTISQAATNSQLIDYIRFCLGKLDSLVDISYDNLVAISQLVLSPSGRKFISKKLIISREFDSLLFRRNTSTKDCDSSCYGGLEAIAEATIISVSHEDYASHRFAAVFDVDKLPPDYEVRYRQEGDVFTPFGGKTKKLKKYFIDKKIPQSERDYLPLIAKGNEVYVIMGVEISDKVRIDNNTTKLSVLGRAD